MRQRALQILGITGLLLLASLALANCSAIPLPVDVERPHPTIVSLNPCSDAILADVADPAQILAISSYSHDPRSSSMDRTLARRFRATGGTVEEVAALHPDVVVAGTFLGPATGAAFARMGLTLDALPIANTVPQAREQVRHLAALVGHPDRGEALVARIDAALAQAAPPPGWRAVPTVIWESGGMVAGDGTLIADLLRRTGFTNFAAARGLGQADVLPLEAMLADPPALILSTGDPRSNEDRMLAHPVLAAMTGTAHAGLDATLLYCGGPTIIRAARRLAAVRAILRPRAGGALGRSSAAYGSRPSTGSGRAGLFRVIHPHPLMLSLSKHARSLAEGYVPNAAVPHTPNTSPTT
ncbi:ABC transporter substrate-binding protein [Novosphingobium lentum]|uniref:ABC transporter substrate-binding protein n=1 Tax=Novosphingobium lentum TaxID=145287 RepID=UPI000A01F46D|nr:ABC transporter substrate-binding protein [Novosphingobium lentum]